MINFHMSIEYLISIKSDIGKSFGFFLYSFSRGIIYKVKTTIIFFCSKNEIVIVFYKIIFSFFILPGAISGVR